MLLFAFPMAIPVSACFNYAVVLSQHSTGSWRGRAKPAADAAVPPGLAGDAPDVELAGGVVTLKRTDASKGNPGDTFGRVPTSIARFRVGHAIEAIARDGDVLTVLRGGTGDLAATLARGDDFQIGVGAITSLVRRTTSIAIEEDPRAAEGQLYGVAAILEQPNTTLIWLNVSDPQHESVIEAMRDAPPGRLVIAIAGDNADERRRMNHRVAHLNAPLPPGRSACWFVDVDERFSAKDDWLHYLRSLPGTRPTDLCLRISVDGVSTVLQEGAYAFARPWHLFVRNVFRLGLPGEWSQLAVARDHPALTRETLVKSTQTIASGRIEISD